MTKDYSDVIEIAHAFLNFEGYVGVICLACGETNNVIQNPNGFWCGCNFYNRGNTGTNLPYKNATFVEKLAGAEIIFQYPEEMVTNFIGE